MPDELEVHLEKLNNKQTYHQYERRRLGNSEAVSSRTIEARSVADRKLSRVTGQISKTETLITERDEAIERREYSQWMGEKVAKQESVGLGARVGGGGANIPNKSSDNDLLNSIGVLQRHPVQNAKEIDRLMGQARSRGILPG